VRHRRGYRRGGGLARLEYRGYDSCGVATFTSHGIGVRKDVEPVAEVACRQRLAAARGEVGIAHTRWTTHGGYRGRTRTHI